MTPSLLIVEDDETIRETIRDALTIEGLAVSACGDGQSALNLIREQSLNPFCLIVLDLMLPGMNGLDLCRKMRSENNNIPILVVSARDHEMDRVLALEVGADDYLVKPFGMRELVARTRALLRRSHAQMPETKVLSFGPINLFPEECRVTRDGREINLSPKEYRLLELFMKYPRRVWGREQLLENIWGHDFFGDSKTVDVHIRWLREKLEENPSEPIYLRTVRGFGYRFG